MAKPFLWWSREDLENEGFTEMYESDEWARMEIDYHGEPGTQMIRLVAADGEVCGEYNATQTCPPNCPPPPPPDDDG